jgi:hypothetical protein
MDLSQTCPLLRFLLFVLRHGLAYVTEQVPQALEQLQ